MKYCIGMDYGKRRASMRCLAFDPKKLVRSKKKKKRRISTTITFDGDSACPSLGGDCSDYCAWRARGPERRLALVPRALRSRLGMEHDEQHGPHVRSHRCACLSRRPIRKLIFLVPPLHHLLFLFLFSFSFFFFLFFLFSFSFFFFSLFFGAVAGGRWRSRATGCWA